MIRKYFSSRLTLAALSLCAAFVISLGASLPRPTAQHSNAAGYDMIPAHSSFNVAVADSDPAPPPADSASGATMDLTLKGDVAHGTDVFGRRCSGCHGDDAMGDKGPKLVGNNILTDDNQFWTVLLEGRKKMPAFKMKLTSQDIADVREFLKTLKATE